MLSENLVFLCMLHDTTWEAYDIVLSEDLIFPVYSVLRKPVFFLRILHDTTWEAYDIVLSEDLVFPVYSVVRKPGFPTYITRHYLVSL